MRARNAALLAALAALANTAARAAAPEASIPFVNQGGIRDWHADRDVGLWVQDAHRRWYYAKLMAPCIGLQFVTGLKFDARPDGTFDRFSAIILPREGLEGRCPLVSLTASEGPPSRQKQPAPRN